VRRQCCHYATGSSPVIVINIRRTSAEKNQTSFSRRCQIYVILGDRMQVPRGSVAADGWSMLSEINYTGRRSPLPVVKSCRCCCSCWAYTNITAAAETDVVKPRAAHRRTDRPTSAMRSAVVTWRREISDVNSPARRLRYPIRYDTISNA